jgi:glucose-6-phosphate isomerase
MPKPSVHLDARFTLAPFGPLKKEAWKRWETALSAARTALLALRTSGEQGWLDLPADRDVLTRVQAAVSATKSCRQLLVLGIGGSDLGPRMAYEALQSYGR